MPTGPVQTPSGRPPLAVSQRDLERVSSGHFEGFLRAPFQEVDAVQRLRMYRVGGAASLPLRQSAGGATHDDQHAVLEGRSTSGGRSTGAVAPRGRGERDPAHRCRAGLGAVRAGGGGELEALAACSCALLQKALAEGCYPPGGGARSPRKLQAHPSDASTAATFEEAPKWQELPRPPESSFLGTLKAEKFYPGLAMSVGLSDWAAAAAVAKGAPSFRAQAPPLREPWADTKYEDCADQELKNQPEHLDSQDADAQAAASTASEAYDLVNAATAEYGRAGTDEAWDRLLEAKALLSQLR